MQNVWEVKKPQQEPSIREGKGTNTGSHHGLAVVAASSVLPLLSFDVSCCNVLDLWHLTRFDRVWSLSFSASFFDLQDFKNHSSSHMFGACKAESCKYTQNKQKHA